jgi:thiol-disulfide isomerase/thioredoxin
MKTKELLAAIAFAVALGGAPATSQGAENVKPKPPAVGLRIPFLHGWLAGKNDASSELAWLNLANAWLNSPALTASDLKGKVVLVDFWTYTCINWRRTLPYLRAWSDKYRDKGLIVIGVHAPEFSFEKDVGNIRRAVDEMHIDYPIAADSDHKIWRAFNNQYWPALYFVDAQGRVRYRQFGEGSYQQAEMMIQELLMENGAADVSAEPAAVQAEGFEAAADWSSLLTPETYIGYDRADNVASYNESAFDSPHKYARPTRLSLNEWSLYGDWTVRSEAAELNRDHGGVAYRFHARDVHLVMGPVASGASVAFRVRIDGEPPGAAHGVDVDENGLGNVTEKRLYQLVRQTMPIADRDFEIEFLDPGVEVFAFTFG